MLERADFDAVLRGTDRFSHRALRVHFLRRPGSHARLGVVIAKRVASRAVDRNRFKRLAREAFRHTASALAGFDIVVVAKSDVLALEPRAVREALDATFERLAKLNAPLQVGTIAR